MNHAEKQAWARERSQAGPSVQPNDIRPTDVMSPEEWAGRLADIGVFLARKGLYEKASTCLMASKLISEMEGER